MEATKKLVTLAELGKKKRLGAKVEGARDSGTASV